MWHEGRQICLDWGYDAYDLIGREVEVEGVKGILDEEFADCVQPGIDEINQYNGRLFVEEWVDTTEWVGHDEHGNRQGGTIDALVVGKHLSVISDLKAGRGVAVQAVDNDQQTLYLLGAYRQIIRRLAPECESFLVIIDQPRNSAGGGYWHLTLDELLERGERIKAAAAACDAPNAPLTPGPIQCQWCPAANVAGRPGGCPAHAQSMIDEIEMDFEDLDDVEAWEPPLVAGLTPERLINLSQHRKSIENFLEYAHAMAIQHLTTHGATAGQKAVLGRAGNRKWASEKSAEAFLRQQLPGGDPFNKKLKSPSQSEKEVGKKYKIPNSLIERGEPKPIMVPVEDARPAILSVEQEFDDVDDL